MDRLRHLRPLAVLAALAGCDDPAPAEPAPSRFAAVSAKSAKAAAEKFCEVRFDAKEKAWSPPPGRPLPADARSDPDPEGEAWTYVNLWASWCQPCVEEMPLLSRWKATLQKEGVPLRMQMWSIDAIAADLAKALDARSYPGEVKWLRSEDDIPALLSSLGLPEDTAIPVHALVDPTGHLRCVRVGKVGAANYPSVKTILSGE